MRARYPRICGLSRSSRSIKIRATAAIATIVEFPSSARHSHGLSSTASNSSLTEFTQSQCGFRAKRSTIGMVFSIRQLQEKCCEQRRSLYLAFIDLNKAFDLISRLGLFTLLLTIGCLPKLLKIIMSFHDSMMSIVQYDGSSSDPFPIKSGVTKSIFLAFFFSPRETLDLADQKSVNFTTVR